VKESLPQHLTHKIRHLYDCSLEELPRYVTRYERLLELFVTAFPDTTPTHLVRAPGRVNLIGEHTDYNGYPVLPMAIDRDFVFMIAPLADATVELVNEDPRFEPRRFRAALPLGPYDQGDWGNYIKAAVNGILEEGVVDSRSAAGFRAVVGGNIPESAGLSSSSALVVASALAFLAANGVSLERRVLAELLAHAERYVGSEGGGMDQAVSLLAEAGAALKIDFFPLRTEAVTLPERLSFVVCNSLIRAPKSEEIRYAYNRRVIECRLAAALLSKAVARRIGKPVQTLLLADLSPEKLGIDPSDVDRIALNAMSNEPLSLVEISRRLEKSVDGIRNEYCRLKGGGILEEPPGGFVLWKRYRHVVTEARRVDRALAALRAGNVLELAELMNESHASCRDDYEISCPELEVLVSLARKHGTLGGRLTGAGFGGCTVNALDVGRTEKFISKIQNEYYKAFVGRGRDRPFIEVRNLNDVIFPCRASKGASVLALQ
jgi:N-acetylgalactosamine kinase